MDGNWYNYDGEKVGDSKSLVWRKYVYVMCQLRGWMRGRWTDMNEFNWRFIWVQEWVISNVFVGLQNIVFSYVRFYYIIKASN